MTYSSYSRPNSYTRVQPQPAKRSLRSRAIVLFALGLVLFVGFKIDLQVKAADHAAALAAQAHTQAQQTAFANYFNQLAANNSTISFSVSIRDLNSGALQTLGNAQPMQAASVGKLLTASFYLHQVEVGQASLRTPVNGYSAKYELRQLINRSDDSAWEVLNDKLGHSNMLSYAQQMGIKSYDPSTDTISTADVALLLEKLYNGSLLNPANTSLLLSWMHGTNYEDIISPAIPKGDIFYHKVGLINDNVNDAGIVKAGNKSLIIVIFSDGHGTMNWDNRAALMQQLTRAALDDYFN